MQRTSTISTTSTTSPVSPHECPLLVVTGPSSLVRLSSTNSQHSNDNQLSVTSPTTSFRRSDSSALSDSELDNVSVRSTSNHSRLYRNRRKLTVSNKNDLMSIASDNSESRLSATPSIAHTPLRASISSPFTKNKLLNNSSPRKSTNSSKRPTRRVSCKDLGSGQCKGWLMKKKEGIGLAAMSWSKRWFVLSHKSLYYYKTEEDEKAEGVIYLPGFKISPAPEQKSKKFAFKAHHTGTTFYFAAERQDDMAKWMNKLGLASLSDLDLGDLVVTAGFWKPDQLRPAKSASQLDMSSQSESHTKVDSEIYCSESEDSLTSEKPSPASSVCNSREDLTELYRNIRKADLDFSGSNVKDRRSTVLLSLQPQQENSEQHDICWRKLISLNRTLKDKEHSLSLIEAFLQPTPITAEHLNSFIHQHPYIVSPHQSLQATDSEQSFIDGMEPAGNSTEPAAENVNHDNQSVNSSVPTQSSRSSLV